MTDGPADGVLDEAEGNMRMALMAASQLAQAAVRARREGAERATRSDLEEARQIQARLDAERLAARAELAPVHQSSWWDQAQPRDVARAYETAVTFRGEDPAARDAESRIRQELRDRYQIEVNETAADPSVVRAALVDQDLARREVELKVEQARSDQDLAVGLTVAADALELVADVDDAQEAVVLRELAAGIEHDVELAWDSAERREAHVAGIQPGEPVAAAAWVQADVDNARHPREAVSSRATRARRPRAASATPGKQVERDGR